MIFVPQIHVVGPTIDDREDVSKVEEIAAEHRIAYPIAHIPLWFTVLQQKKPKRSVYE